MLPLRPLLRSQIFPLWISRGRDGAEDRRASVLVCNVSIARSKAVFVSCRPMSPWVNVTKKRGVTACVRCSLVLIHMRIRSNLLHMHIFTTDSRYKRAHTGKRILSLFFSHMWIGKSIPSQTCGRGQFVALRQGLLGVSGGIGSAHQGEGFAGSSGHPKYGRQELARTHNVMSPCFHASHSQFCLALSTPFKRLSARNDVQFIKLNFLCCR